MLTACFRRECRTNAFESRNATLSLVERTALTRHLSESFWTTDSNERQADSRDETECHEAKRDSTTLGRGSDEDNTNFCPNALQPRLDRSN